MGLLEEAFYGGFPHPDFPLSASAWAEVASGWDETEHPRWPVGDPHGGQFRPKGTLAGGEDIDWEDPTMKEALKQAREVVAAKRIAVKVGQAENLRAELGDWYYGRDADGKWVVGASDPQIKAILDNWGNWTLSEMSRLRVELEKQLSEEAGGGLLSAQYAREVGRSLTKARGEARRVLAAVDKAITIEQFGLEDAQRLYPELFQAKVPKAKQPNPRDQGVPEIYLTEKGTFKPGYDAKLKSDLVNSYFDLNPQKETVSHTTHVVSIETQSKVAEWWKSRNADEQARHGWSDAEIFKLARSDPQMPSELYNQVLRESGGRTVRRVESTLLHRFDPVEAKRILEERGWTSHLEKKRNQLGGLLEREPTRDDLVSRGILEEAYGVDRGSNTPHSVKGRVNINGFHLGSVQELVGSAAEIPKGIHEQLADKGVTLYFGPPESTDLNEMWSIRDEKARNRDRRTMKQVAGFYQPSGKKVIISADPRSGSADLSAHEIGHAIGDVLGVDDDPALAGFHRGFKSTGKLGRYYLQNGNDYAGAQELWAEGVALHYHLQRNKRLGREVTYRRSGPFKDAAFLDTPEGRAYMDWVKDTLAEIERGAYIP